MIQFQKNDDVGHVGYEKFIYLLVIQESDNEFVDRFVYIVSETLLKWRGIEIVFVDENSVKDFSIIFFIISISRDFFRMLWTWLWIVNFEFRD